MRVGKPIKNMLSNISTKNLIGPAIGVGAGAMSYNYHRNEGRNVAGSLVAAASEMAVYGMFPWLIGFDIAVPVISGIPAAYQQARQRNYNVRQATDPSLVGGGYIDTQEAYTMRQQANKSIQESYANVRATFGNEARYYGKG